jgi:ATP-dependent helicase/nuclease subunit A
LSLHPQLQASHPATSAFVAANAGSGKTKTLVERVARLLLHGAQPETILCVTYTKAAAAEMQRRLFKTLGDWSVWDDARLAAALGDLGEIPADLARARTLFARALETPGGLKIQTLHAFCEKLLQRFPLEAGVSPGFRIMDDAAAAEISARARERLGLYAADHPDGIIAQAYAHFAVELDLTAFEGLLKTFETDRTAIQTYLQTAGGLEQAAAALWLELGFPDGAADPDQIEAEAVAACRGETWLWAANALRQSGKPSELELADAMIPLARGDEDRFEAVRRLFITEKGTARVQLGTAGLAPEARAFLRQEQVRILAADESAKAARVGRDTHFALSLADAYAALYAFEKSTESALDFSDLIQATRHLLTEGSASAWVLYKLDGGVDHVLVDEAQDTSPDQWAILRALTAEFFVGDGRREAAVAQSGRKALPRTLFAVGDQKQSIYSFQGADPTRLKIETETYRAMALAADRRFQQVPLLESWRSTPEVLDFVDRVFSTPSARQALGLDEADAPLAHVAVRPAGWGGVDLWPLVQDEARTPPGAWDAPQDLAPPDSARKRLARSIAASVRATIAHEAVVAKGRPDSAELRAAAPGDVLVLVRRRDALFEEIIRALKKAGVPVAGADRLALSNHVVFADVLSLCRFCLFKEDDLTLAELLRSPFCAVDEEALFDLAHGREGSLWSTLRRRAPERAAFAEAAEFLQWAAEEAVARPPYDFLGRTLARLDNEGRSVRQRILTRLGREAEDALDEVMAQALAAEGRGVLDLERLVGVLEQSDIHIKRELDAEDGGYVRVMTVHGAKGLEAPVVILPDTTGRGPSQRSPLLRTHDGGYLFAPRKAEDCKASRGARDLADTRAAEEQLRLLYVALTRARDRLVVAGRLATRNKAAPAGSWYALVQAAFDGAKAGAVRLVEAEGRAMRRLGADPPAAPAAAPVQVRPAAPPHWLRTAPPSEQGQARHAPSSAVTGRRAAAPSPLAVVGGLGRFRRGALIHKLLQVLPDVPAPLRSAAAERLLVRERDLTQAQRQEMAAAALGVLADPQFAEVFGPGSRAEAALAGSAPELPPGYVANGQVDRMVVTPDRVLVVDFKTNRPAPDRPEAADPAYIRQLAIYAALLRGVFPARRVEAALVWTEGPKLMPIPDHMIAQALLDLGENN